MEVSRSGIQEKCIHRITLLLLRLQTVDKRAVETTGVTKSFGWDSSEGITITLCYLMT